MTDGPQSIGGDEDVDEIDMLGAAPTVPASEPTKRADSGKSRTGFIPPSLRSPSRKLLIGIAVIVILALIPLFASTLKKTPRNMVGISYGGGPFESAHFQRIVMPGSALFFNGFFDPLYLYPADTQNYIVSKTVGQGAVTQPDSIISPSKDRVQIEYQVAVYFRLNIDRLRAFHESLGLQYAAYTSGGWKKLITDTFRQQLENSLQEETRKYDVADLYGNADVLTTIQNDVQKALSNRLIASLGQPYFCSPTYEPGKDCGSPQFNIKKIDIPPDVVKAYQDNRTSQIQVQTAQNTIAQRQAEAQAIEALNAGLSQAGMPYVLLRAIESGNISFWVLPSDAGVTLQVPQGGGAPTAPTTTAPAPPPASSSSSSSSSTSSAN
jgi:regulator of protease activity HflC (stomatin/prohibitin superfamily)